MTMEATSMTRGGKQSLSEEDRRVLRGLLAACEPFHKASETMPLETVRTFLTVAAEEGLDGIEIGRRTGLRPNAVSRHLQDLSARNRYKEEGLEWLYQKPSIEDMRRNLSYLTDVGRAIAHQLIRCIK
jgi:DNA-binding MarR family transcriptional regulator